MSFLHHKPKYKRIVLKISGAALAGKNGFGIDKDMLNYLAEEIKPLVANKVEIGIIIGGGNLFRGADLIELNRVTADQMGMLATICNSLALRDVFLNHKISTRVMSPVSVTGMIESYDVLIAKEALKQGQVMIFSGGIGNPFVTTDTALGLRGIELQADLLLKATNVDGVYSANPLVDTNAEFFSHLTYDEALEKKLQIMDLIAFSLCKDHNRVLRVYNVSKAQALSKIISGADIGTLITNPKN